MSTVGKTKPSTVIRSNTTPTGSALSGRELSTAIFGENLTTNGSLEDSVHIGDRMSVGSAEVVVAQPRLPCYGLGIRFECDHMVEKFLASGRTGFYLAVIREGEVGAGDEIKITGRDPIAVSVSEITRLYFAKDYGQAEVAAVQRSLQIAALSGGWKRRLQERLERTERL